MSIYLLHFDPPYKHAGHYIGFTTDLSTLTARLEHHRKGTGNPLVKAAHDAGSVVVLARVWPDGTRTQERTLKKRGGAARICPVCSGEAADKRAVLPSKPLAPQ